MQTHFNNIGKIAKESITVDFYNRDTTQLVEFSNPNNIFHGNFVGILSSDQYQKSGEYLSCDTDTTNKKFTAIKMHGCYVNGRTFKFYVLSAYDKEQS